MKKLIHHIKIWNQWRKRSLNGKGYKLLVLFGLANSPTLTTWKALGLYNPPEFKYKEIDEVEL